MDGEAGNSASRSRSTLARRRGLRRCQRRAGRAAAARSSFILTLGSALALYGLTQIYSGGTARGIVAPGFREFFNHRIGDVLPVLALVDARAGRAVGDSCCARRASAGRST